MPTEIQGHILGIKDHFIGFQGGNQKVESRAIETLDDIVDTIQGVP